MTEQRPDIIASISIDIPVRLRTAEEKKARTPTVLTVEVTEILHIVICVQNEEPVLFDSGSTEEKVLAAFNYIREKQVTQLVGWNLAWDFSVLSNAADAREVTLAKLTGYPEGEVVFLPGLSTRTKINGVHCVLYPWEVDNKFFIRGVTVIDLMHQRYRLQQALFLPMDKKYFLGALTDNADEKGLDMTVVTGLKGAARIKELQDNHGELYKQLCKNHSAVLLSVYEQHQTAVQSLIYPTQLKGI